MRLVANYVHRRACQACDGADLRFSWPGLDALRPMLSLGGWMAISNIISPLMGALDRLLISAIVPVAVIGMYATAYDMVTKVLILAYSVTGAAFPFVAGIRDDEDAKRVYARFTKVMLLLTWPVLFAASLGAHSLFLVWLGPRFAEVSAPCMRILAIGLFFNCMAQIPAMFVQGRGSPKWMAIMHLAEMPIFLVVIYGLTRRFGVMGTASAWTIRVTLDAVVLFLIADRKLVRGALHSSALQFFLFFAAVALFAAAKPLPILLALAVGLLGVSAFLFGAWKFLLSGAERHEVVSMFRGRLIKGAA